MDNGDAKSAEKQQECGYSKPLYAIDGFKQVFVHFIECLSVWVFECLSVWVFECLSV
jgi:hypothetical protein